MVLELPMAWVIVLNAAGLPALQLGCAWLFTRLPGAWFEVAGPVRRKPRSQAYERILRIKKWKDLMPDGATWFRGGFAKASLSARDPRYLGRFLAETRRGEACHWLVLVLCPLFFLWNPWWGDLVIALYAVLANLPCILIQRYNRSRFERVLAGKL